MRATLTPTALGTLLGKVDVPVEYEVGFTITPGADTEPGWGESSFGR